MLRGGSAPLLRLADGRVYVGRREVVYVESVG